MLKSGIVMQGWKKIYRCYSQMYLQLQATACISYCIFGCYYPSASAFIQELILFVSKSLF